MNAMNYQLYKKLTEFQLLIQAPKVNKNNQVNFNYRNAEEILKSIKEAEKMMDVCIYCSSRVEVVESCIYQFVEAHFVCEHGEVVATAMASEYDSISKAINKAQVSGSALSYAKKYALCNLLNIDDSKIDPDYLNERLERIDKEEQKKAEPKKAEPKKAAAAPEEEPKPNCKHSDDSKGQIAAVKEFFKIRPKASEYYETNYFGKPLEEFTDLDYLRIYGDLDNRGRVEKE